MQSQIYNPDIVSARDMQFYAETQAERKNGYVPLRRLPVDLDEQTRMKYILADRKHFAQWKLRKIRRQEALALRAQRKLEKEIEEERAKLEALFWEEAPIMRPYQWAEWEKWNWPEFYAKHRTTR